MLCLDEKAFFRKKQSGNNTRPPSFVRKAEKNCMIRAEML